MSQLQIEAINPVQVDTLLSLDWMIRQAHWELTCGFCRHHFRRSVSVFAPAVDCPACGTGNLLPLASRQRRPLRVR